MKRNSKKRVLVTAGPTRAYLDDVRYISNYSSGSTGFAIVKELLKQNYEVEVIAGPTPQPWEELKKAPVHTVETHAEMFKQVLLSCRKFKPEVIIFSAAVLDFAPAKVRSGKVSSKKSDWTIKLVPTPKIIDAVGKRFPLIKRIGFKLESKKLPIPKLEKLGQSYLSKKNLDGLCLNFLSEIKGQKHPLYIFDKTGLIAKSKNKKQAAIQLAHLVSNLKYPR